MLLDGRVRRSYTYSAGAPAISAASAITPRYRADGMPPSQASTTYSHANAGSVSVSDAVRSTRQRIFLWMPSSEPSQRSRFSSSSLVTS